MRLEDSFDLLSGQEFARFCEDHGISLAVLFGSMADGRGRPDSDIDLAVVVDVPRSTLADAGFGRRLMRDVIEFIGTSEVDLVILNRADPLLRYQVACGGKPLYESSPGTFASFCSLAVRQREDSRVFDKAVDRYLRRFLKEGETDGRSRHCPQETAEDGSIPRGTRYTKEH